MEKIIDGHLSNPGANLCVLASSLLGSTLHVQQQSICRKIEKTSYTWFAASIKSEETYDMERYMQYNILKGVPGWLEKQDYIVRRLDISSNIEQ